MGLALCALLSPFSNAGAEPSWLGTPTGRISSTYQRRTYPDLSGHLQHRTVQPLQLIALGDLRGIARQDIRLSFLARMDRDLGEEAVDRADLLFGYLEARRLGGVVDLRVGRRVILDGSTRGALEGVWLDLSGLPWMGLGAHLGRPVSFSDEPSLPTYSVGGRAWLHGVRWAHVELRFEQVEPYAQVGQSVDGASDSQVPSPSGEPRRSRLGGDLYGSLHDDWIFFANMDHELHTKTMERVRAGLRYRPPGRLRAGLEVFHYDPVFDPGSVFATMQSDPHWGFLLRGDYGDARRWSLFLRWTTRFFKRIEYGETVYQDMLYPDPSHMMDIGGRGRPWGPAELGLSMGVVSGEEGSSFLGQLDGALEHRPLGLGLRVGGYLNAHDRRFNDPSGILELFGDTSQAIKRNLASGAWCDLELAPWRTLAFSLRGELLMDESAHRSTRILARLTGYLY